MNVNPNRPDFEPSGHLMPDTAMELRRYLLDGTRLKVWVALGDPGRPTSFTLGLPEDPGRLAAALTDLADVVDPKDPTPGREEPLEAPELAETLATAYEAMHGELPDSAAAYGALDAEADALLGALGAVLASAYLEGRRRA